MVHNIYDLKNELNRTCDLLLDLSLLVDTIYKISSEDVVYIRLSDIEYRLRNHTSKDIDSSISYLKSLNDEIETLKCEILLASFNNFNNALIVP